MWITLSLLGLWRRTCFIHLWLSGAPHLIGCYGEDGHRVATVHLSHHRVLTHPAQQLHAVYRWDTNTHTHCQNRVMGKDESSFFKVPYPTTPFLKPSSSYTHLQSSQNSLRLRATKVYCHFFFYIKRYLMSFCSDHDYLLLRFLLTSLQDEAGVSAPVSHQLSEHLWKDERNHIT